MSSAKPVYRGTIFIENHLFDGGKRDQASVELVGQGKLMAVEPGKGILAHRYANGAIKTYIALNQPEAWCRALDVSQLADALRRLARELEGWAPPLRAFVTDSDTAPIARFIHALPIGHRWDRVPSVTLIGDTADLMSPFTGEGANLAIYDSAALAGALLSHPGDTQATLVAYEAVLFPCSASIVERTAWNHRRFFGDDAPRSVAKLFAARSVRVG